MGSPEFWNSISLLMAFESKKFVEDDIKARATDWANSFVMGATSQSQSSSNSNNEVKDVDIVLCHSDSTLLDPKVVEKFIESLNLPKIECKFGHPQIRSKLERLMGSDVVSLTDRNYMNFLQERILQDYANSMAKRIVSRQADEMERVKNLVLTGKIPLDQAPPEMYNHPVMHIDQYCRKILAEKRAKIKVLKPFIPKHLYWDDTPDPPSGLSIESGHVLRKDNDLLCIPPDVLLEPEPSEVLPDGYMMEQENYDLLKYESPLIKKLKECETVKEMYRLADEIIGYFADPIDLLEEEDEGSEPSANAA